MSETLAQAAARQRNQRRVLEKWIATLTDEDLATINHAGNILSMFVGMSPTEANAGFYNVFSAATNERAKRR